jgi:hypothetical protein
MHKTLLRQRFLFLTVFPLENMSGKVPTRDPQPLDAALVYRRGTCPVLLSCRLQCRIRPIESKK